MQISTDRIPPLSLRKATKEDSGRIADLVNSAYRGDSSSQGWTTEAELLDGNRINQEEVRTLIEAEKSMILLCLDGTEIIGSVHLRKMDSAAYLGLFVVKPTLQGMGIGKCFMQAAENIAQKEWGIVRMSMTVINRRQELIAYYERRGYRRTGQISPFPAHAGASIPRVEGLQLEVLEKDLEAEAASKDVGGV
jgi:ribosomal protein S18 acetylase RimI-like enzyme